MILQCSKRVWFCIVSAGPSNYVGIVQSSQRIQFINHINPMVAEALTKDMCSSTTGKLKFYKSHPTSKKRKYLAMITERLTAAQPFH